VPTLGGDNQSDDTNLCSSLNLSLKQAIDIISKIERARQSIQRAKVLQKLKSDQPLKQLRDEICNVMDENTAAITIQRVYKGHSIRAKLAERALDEMLFLNMALPNKLSNNKQTPVYADLSLPNFAPHPTMKQNAIREKRVNLRIENEVEFERSIPEIRDAVILEQGPKIREQARQERFEWSIKQRQIKGAYPTKFDQFYKEKEAIKNGIDLNATPLEPEESKKGKKKKGGKKEKKGDKKKKGGDKKKGKKDKKGKGKKKKKGGDDDGVDMDDPNVHIVTPSIVANEIKNEIKKAEEWRVLDEKDNFSQKHSIEMVKTTLMPSVEKEIESEVDKQLLIALDNLKGQLGIKKGGKGKKGKKAKKGKKGKKKGKKSKKKKKS